MMASVKLPYIEVQRDRNGKPIYWYFRRNGRRWKLPGQPLTEEFATEYQHLKTYTDGLTAASVEAPIDKRTYAPGSFGALASDYLGCGNYKQLKPRTKAEYKRVLEGLQKRHGDKPVSQIRRRHVRKMRDERTETRGAANTIVRMLKLVLRFAVDEEWIEANPAARMPLLKVGEWRAWTDEECEQFEARWAPGTMERRAYALAIYTGQRLTDLVGMARAHRKNGSIRVVQSKTGEELWIAEHKELTAELGRGVIGHMSLLTTTQGKAFDPVYFGAWFAGAIDEAKLPDDCVLHGLRKTAARKLAEAGCTAEEIKAVTGHTTSRMVDHYTKGANQKKQASAAILKLERNSE
jgi:integrase